MKARPLLFSLQPQYADLVFAGDKTIELRRRAGDIANREAFIYVSSPNRILRGGFKIGKIWSGQPDKLWKKVSESAGISRETYYSYYAGTNTAFALEILDAWEYTNPKSLEDLRLQFPGFVVPQSYRQISATEEKSWSRLKKTPKNTRVEKRHVLAINS